MPSELLERTPISQTVVGKCALRRAKEEPRNNLLLQLGNVDKVKPNKARLAKYSLVDERRMLDGNDF
jgi:hypothetical protein